MKGSRSSAGNGTGLRVVGSEGWHRRKKGSFPSARQCPLNVGRSLEPEGVTCLQLLANGRRNRGEVKTGEGGLHVVGARREKVG